MTPGWTLVTIIGMTAITLFTRTFFLLSDREWPLPAWLREALRFAPLAALVAVVVPEVLLDHGQLIDTWRDARPYAACAAVAWALWRRSFLGTIVIGTVVLLALRVGLGW